MRVTLSKMGGYVMNNSELSRAVALHEGWIFNKGLRGRDGLGPMVEPYWSHPDGRRASEPFYATSWEWTGPLLDKYFMSSYTDWNFGLALTKYLDLGETLLRTICLAVLDTEE